MYGEVVKYWSLPQQLAVESYFRSSQALTPLYYWVGVSRAAKTVEYRYTLDGGRLPQGPSNAPYAHWTWYQPTATTKPNYDCILAYSSYAYAQYTGAATGEAARNQGSYQVRQPCGLDSGVGCASQHS